MLSTGKSTLVSVTPLLEPPPGKQTSGDAALAGDGSLIAFESDFGGLVPNDLNGERDVFAVSMSSLLGNETSRVGTPANPDVLKPGLTGPPKVGKIWLPFVDHSTGFAPTAVVDFIFVSAAPDNVPTANGTLLCAAPTLFITFAAPNVPFAAPVPNIPTLAGVQICAQAGCFLNTSITPLELTNALDAVIGAF